MATARPAKVSPWLRFLRQGCCKALVSITFFCFIPFSGASPSDFQSLLAESSMTYRLPDGFIPVKPTPNNLLDYEHAVRNKANTLEIRYVIRPIGRLEIDYDDPHSSAPEPNHMFHMLFSTLSNRLSGGRYNPDKTIHPKEAKHHFSADWAAISVFDLDPEFSSKFSQALMVAMHKDDKADAYVVFLYNSFKQVRKKIYANFNTLAFKSTEAKPPPFK